MDSMPRMHTLMVSLALCVSAFGQDPKPTAESKPIWSAHEAHAFAYAQRLAANWRALHSDQWDWRVHAQTVAGYTPVRFNFGPDGSPLVVVEQVDPAKFYAPGNCLLYLVPVTDDASTRRMVCIRGDGLLAFTDNTAGLSLLDDDKFQTAKMFGDGIGDELRKFPRTAMRSDDGNFWLPEVMLEAQQVNVMVVDELSNPHSMEDLAFEPAEPAFVVDHLLPAGRFRTTMEGSAQLRGPSARGLGLVLRRGNTAIWIEPSKLTVNGRSVRVVVERAVINRFFMNRNEWAAIATLKNICSAQSQCQASGAIDQNQNGAGEYGTFAELAGGMPLRGRDRAMTPPVLSAAFRNVKDGMVTRSGYCFAMFLPGKDGEPLSEAANGGGQNVAIDASQAEVLWCCYAWPIKAGESAQRVFFINQAGDVLAMSNDQATFSGPAQQPPASAAYVDKVGMKSALAANRAGADGHEWVVVQ